MQASLAKDKERTILSGNASVKTGSISILADRIELFGKDFTYLQCTGSVTVVDSDKKIRLESPSLYYDRDKKLLRTQGPSVLQDDKNHLVLKAEWIESDNDKRGHSRGGGRPYRQGQARVPRRVCPVPPQGKLPRADGLSLGFQGRGHYEASRIIVNTDTEDIQLEGEVQGSVIDKNAPAKDTATPAAPEAQSTPEAPGNSPPEAPKEAAPPRRSCSSRQRRPHDPRATRPIP